MTNSSNDPADLKEAYQQGDVKKVVELCESTHPADVAEALAEFEPEDIWGILSQLSGETLSEVFFRLEADVQTAIAESLSRRELATLVTVMAPDDRVDLLKSLSPEKHDTLLPVLAHAEREDIRRLASFPEGTAGAVMTSDYAMLSPHQTAGDAIAKVRREAPDKETIYYCYVVGPARKLLGFVSLKDLILSPADKKIEDMMKRDVISVKADEDQEDAARKIAEYDLIALPVVNDNGALLGIITEDDAIDIIEQEHTEDLEKFMAISGEHQAGSYLRQNARKHFTNRVGWIVGLAMLGLVSGRIVQGFEGALEQLAILAFFMPMVADTGGNIGSQSASVIIQALALKEISVSNAAKIILKEFRISLLLAAVLGILAFGNVFILSMGFEIDIALHKVAFAIALGLTLQAISSAVIGSILPLLAAALKKDPAVVASPMLTTLVDLTGLVIYFTTATIILGLH